MTDSPSFDAFKRDHVVLAPNPFKADDEATRPWAVINTEDHPFDRDQYVVMGLTTKTWYEARLPLEMDDYRHRRAPRASSIIPHAVTSLQPSLMTDSVCRIHEEPLDRAVDVLLDHL